MEEDIFDLNSKIYSNNNNILLGIIDELQQTMKDSKENITIKRLADIITQMNKVINENRKNTELIRNYISKLYNQMNQQFNELKNNNILNNQEIKYNNSERIKYIGQVLNGVPEGKGVMYWDNGDRYNGEWKNDKKEGKGIYYNNNGDRYEGDFKNGLFEGKGIEYFNDGDRYEGDWKNDKVHGNGIYYYSNGDREMGDYVNGKEIGKHATLTLSGEVKEILY